MRVQKIPSQSAFGYKITVNKEAENVLDTLPKTVRRGLNRAKTKAEKIEGWTEQVELSPIFLRSFDYKGKSSREISEVIKKHCSEQSYCDTLFHRSANEKRPWGI